MSKLVEQLLRDRDEACRPELERIGKAIGYGNSCRILGELWDAHLVATYGPGFEGRGRMERRPEVEALEAAEARAERYRKALERIYRVLGQEVPDCLGCEGCKTEWQEALDELRRNAPEAAATVDAEIAARAALRGEG